MFWGNNQQRLTLLQLLLERCDKIAEIAHQSKQEHHLMAEKWGKTHIILGLLTIFFSSISAVFAFSSVQTLVIASSLISTILASCITFLNPSQREIKRRISSNQFLSLIQSAEQTKVSLRVKGIEEDDMIELVENLNKKLDLLINETFKNH